MAGVPGGLDPELESAAFALAGVVAEAGASFRFTSGRRSHSEQARLYRRSLQGLQKYPVAPPGTSAHEYGWAFDAVTDPWDWQADVGQVWKSWGGSWGGRGDPVHFELPGASAAAKQAVRVPNSEAAQALATVADFVVGFLPGIGAIELGASILGLFPGFSESETVEFLSGPYSYSVKHPDFLLKILRSLPLGALL